MNHVTLKQAADIIGRSPDQTKRILTKHGFAGERIGSMLVFHRADVQRVATVRHNKTRLQTSARSKS